MLFPTRLLRDRLRPLLILWPILTIAAMNGSTTARSAPPDDSRTVTLGPSIRAVLDRVTPSVVGLWYGEAPQAHCTGTIISADGLIVTCEHLSAKAGDPIEARLSDGRRVKAKVLAKLKRIPDEANDLALVKLDETGPWPAVEVGTAVDLSSRDSLISIGFGSTGLYTNVGEEPPMQVHLGRRLLNVPPHQGMLLTDIRGVGGDSGGPIFDLGGRLVGTLSGGGTRGSHSHFMTADLLRKEWPALAGDLPSPQLPQLPRPTAASPDEELAEAIRGMRDSIVEIRSDDRWSGLGALLSGGRILTKASELGPNITVVLRNNFPARVHLTATDPARDLALLTLQAPDLAEGIRPIEFDDAADPPAGTVVACVTTADFAPPTGVISVSARIIKPVRGGLAAFVKDGAGGAEVVETIDDLNEMWLRPIPHDFRAGDVITEIGGAPVRNRQEYIDRFRAAPEGVTALISGDLVRVTFLRDGSSRTITSRLRPGYTVSHELIWPASYRYTGFPSAFNCDVPTRPEHCGAPVIDASGRAVGILIARAPFVESLVIPAREVRKSLELMVK